MVRVQNFTPYDSANIHTFTLANTDTLTQTIYDREFTMLRVSDFDSDNIYVYTNNAPATHRYKRYKVDGSRHKQIHYALEEIPLHPGYNDYTVSYRQIKIQKDTLARVDYGIEIPRDYYNYDDPRRNDYSAYDPYYEWNNGLAAYIKKTDTVTLDSAIMVSSRNEVDLVMGKMRDTDLITLYAYPLQPPTQLSLPTPSQVCVPSSLIKENY